MRKLIARVDILIVLLQELIARVHELHARVYVSIALLFGLIYCLRRIAEEQREEVQSDAIAPDPPHNRCAVDESSEHIAYPHPTLCIFQCFVPFLFHENKLGRDLHLRHRFVEHKLCNSEMRRSNQSFEANRRSCTPSHNTQNTASYQAQDLRECADRLRLCTQIHLVPSVYLPSVQENAEPIKSSHASELELLYPLLSALKH